MTIYLIIIDFLPLSYNASYASSALSTSNATGDVSQFTNLKYGDVFKESARTFDDACGTDSPKCIVSCSCNEANGWFSSTSEVGSSSVYTLTTKRAYAGNKNGITTSSVANAGGITTSSASQSLITTSSPTSTFASVSPTAANSNGTVTCYKKKEGCPDGYYKDEPDKSIFVFDTDASSGCYMVDGCQYPYIDSSASYWEREEVGDYHGFKCYKSRGWPKGVEIDRWLTPTNKYCNDDGSKIYYDEKLAVYYVDDSKFRMNFSDFTITRQLYGPQWSETYQQTLHYAVTTESDGSIRFPSWFTPVGEKYYSGSGVGMGTAYLNFSKGTYSLSPNTTTTTGERCLPITLKSDIEGINKKLMSWWQIGRDNAPHNDTVRQMSVWDNIDTGELARFDFGSNESWGSTPGESHFDGAGTITDKKTNKSKTYTSTSTYGPTIQITTRLQVNDSSKTQCGACYFPCPYNPGTNGCEGGFLKGVYLDSAPDSKYFSYRKVDNCYAEIKVKDYYRVLEDTAAKYGMTVREVKTAFKDYYVFGDDAPKTICGKDYDISSKVTQCVTGCVPVANQDETFDWENYNYGNEVFEGTDKEDLYMEIVDSSVEDCACPIVNQKDCSDYNYYDESDVKIYPEFTYEKVTVGSLTCYKPTGCASGYFWNECPSGTIEHDSSPSADGFTCLKCVEENKRCPNGYTETDSIYVDIRNGVAFFNAPASMMGYHAIGYVSTNCLTYIRMEETWNASETGKGKTWTSTDPNCHLVYGAVTLGCEKSN